MRKSKSNKCLGLGHLLFENDLIFVTHVSSKLCRDLQGWLSHKHQAPFSQSFCSRCFRCWRFWHLKGNEVSGEVLCFVLCALWGTVLCALSPIQAWPQPVIKRICLSSQMCEYSHSEAWKTVDDLSWGHERTMIMFVVFRTFGVSEKPVRDCGSKGLCWYPVFPPQNNRTIYPSRTPMPGSVPNTEQAPTTHLLTEGPSQRQIGANSC